MKIISFNLLCGWEGVKAWEPRRELVVKTIKNYAPDVFGVQEAHIYWMNALSEDLPEYSYAGKGRDDGRDKGEFSAVFFRKDKYELLEQKTKWLSRTPSIPSKSWNSRCTRIATYALLRDKESGEKLLAINTHIDHVSEEAQVNQAQVLCKIAGKFGEVPVVVTGDFNTFPDHDVHKIMLENGYKDCREIAEESDDSYTFHAFDLVPDDKVYQKIIDYIYVKNIEKVKSYKVIKDSFDGKRPSDHYPIIAEV